MAAADSQPLQLSAAARGRRGVTTRRPARQGGGPLGVVAPNSRLHWALLIASLAGAVGFNLTLLVDGALRPGYDALRQPMSALSLGPGGWVQVVNFIAYGLLGCVTAFAMRPTLAPGTGAVWYPRLRVVVGLALVGAGVFAQDPDNGFPVGVPVPAHPTVHAQLHLLASYISLTVIVAELLILGRRFAREPGWRGWATAAWGSGVLMMGFLAAFGTLMAAGGPGGMFEKLASLTPHHLRRRLHHPPAGHP